MPSVAKPTILDFITDWVGLTCRACGLPIHSVLVRQPAEVRNGELIFPESVTDLCTICQRRHAPAAMGSAIEAGLKASFVARAEILHELGIGRALHLYWPVTLFSITGYRHRGKRVLDGPRDPRAVMYALLGRGPRLPKTSRAAKTVGPFPPPILHPPDAAGFPGAAFVVIGADITDPQFPGARVEMSPRPGILTEPYDLRIINGHDLDTIDQAELLKTARMMFGASEMSVTRGRKVGSAARFETPQDFEQAVLNAIQALRARGERVSKAAIGRHIGRTYEPSWRGDDRQLADPGGQVRRWERDFGIDVAALIRRTLKEQKPRH